MIATRSRGTLRRKRSDALKKRIVSTAITLIAEGGASDATVARVARKLGIFEGSVYWHFGNRAGLLRAVIDEIIERGSVAIDPALLGPEVPIEAKLAGMVDRHVHIARTQPAAFRAASVLFSDRKLMDQIGPGVFEDLLERRRPMRELLREASEKGVIRDVSPAVFHDFLSSAVQGVHLHLQQQPAGYDPEPLFLALRRALLGLLGLQDR